ncbi:hypothetical protein DY000_02022266 [Brassica cretica]|uniref:Secreted protein n=1 Tax=Brassica cretica TaxID=69181 RepID=A0ABQ7ECT2_BRACR|nr:hypothetical protein DY000_02022266 [Brassica cretica]
MILFLFFQFLLFFPTDLSDRVVVSPSLRFPHTSNSFYSDMRPVSIDGEVIASIDAGLLVSFDGIRSVSTDGASAGPLSISSLNHNPL